MLDSFGRLEFSDHPLALLAQIAFARGVFLRAERDLLDRGAPDWEGEAARVVAFLASSSATEAGRAFGAIEWHAREPTSQLFERFVRVGQGLRRAGASAELGRLSLGRVKLNDEMLRENGWPRVYFGFHHMGTTRMADDPTEGVVDRNCLIHGLSNI